MYNQPMLRPDALSGKTIIVTGGGSGLGKSMAKYFCELGANVVITGRRKEKLEAAAAEFQENTEAKVLCISGDVRDYKGVQAAVEEIHATFGRIDGLVNNAAGNFVSPTEKLTEGGFDAIVSIVLKGTFNWTHCVGKYWIDNNTKGSVLNVVTTYAWTGSGYVVPSAAAKAGVLAMTRSLAVEWGRKYGIRLNAVAPGPFPTKGAWERLLPGDLKDKFDPANRVPLQRVGEHQELSNLAAYLISDFSGYINGEVISIDGGEWLQGAGQFNGMHEVTEEMWEMFRMMMTGKGKK